MIKNHKQSKRPIFQVESTGAQGPPKLHPRLSEKFKSLIKVSKRGRIPAQKTHRGGVGRKNSFLIYGKELFIIDS